MTLAPTTEFDVFPRIDVTFCYVCNATIKTERVEGDRARKALQHQQRANELFVNTEHFDVHPLLCDKQSCHQSYLALPKQLYFEIEVPYNTAITFDNGSFFGFPGRIGWTDIDERNTDGALSQSYNERIPDLEPLFQAWLFFGLLHEIFQERYKENDFVKFNENGEKVLSLPAVLEAVILWMPTVSRTERQTFIRLNDALQITFNMLKAIRYTEFNENLRVLIASTGEIIWKSLNSLFPLEDVTRNFILFYYRKPEEHLVDLGWCPSRAKLLSQRLSTITRQALYSQIDMRGHCPSHDNCTSTKCEQDLIVPQHPKNPSHRSGCVLTDCRFVTLSTGQRQYMFFVLDEGSFPLLQMISDDTGSISLRLSAYKPGIRYIAISHVWAQGLGNEDANGLNLCQLNNLHQLVQSLWQLMFPDDKGEYLFWLDTICCPVRAGAEDRYRKLAIGLMRETYAKATAVLVIDTEWGNVHSLAFSPLEVAARIFNSSWFQRLWTLQEGTLPAQVWFRFKDGAINAHSLHLALRDILRGPDMRDRLAATEMLGLFMSLRILSGVYQSLSQEQEMSLLTLTMAGRKVMHAKDEAICIATLIGLDTRRILAESTLVERMKAMWLELSRKQLIPRNIIFSSGEKLGAPGFSWAYSTFLQDLAPLGFRSNPAIKGIASEHGLLVKGEGIVFKMATPTEGFDPRYLLGDLPMQIDVFNIRLRHDEWHRFTTIDGGIPGIEQAQPNVQTPRWIDFWHSGKEYALLRKHISSCSTSVDDGAYLLVEVNAREKDAMLCRRLIVGKLSVLSTVEGANNSRACYQAGFLQGHDDFRALRYLENQPQGDGTSNEALRGHINILRHLSFDQQLLQRNDFPEALRPTGPDPLFQIRLVAALAGRYALGIEQLAEDQKWYID